MAPASIPAAASTLQFSFRIREKFGSGTLLGGGETLNAEPENSISAATPKLLLPSHGGGSGGGKRNPKTTHKSLGTWLGSGPIRFVESTIKASAVISTGSSLHRLIDFGFFGARDWSLNLTPFGRHDGWASAAEGGNERRGKGNRGGCRRWRRRWRRRWL